MALGTTWTSLWYTIYIYVDNTWRHSLNLSWPHVNYYGHNLTPLGTTWASLGYNVDNNWVTTWWPPGNHLVTTWWPLVEQLVTPLFYTANWRPPDSWLLVERTYSNTGCPKINHFKSGQFLPQLLLATAATTRSEFMLFESGPCCPFWCLFGYFLGRPVKFLMFLSPRVGANKVWGRMVPAFKGLGYGMLLVGIYNLSAIT